MRRRLIEALTYPRMIVMKIIEARDCPHESLFEATSERCHQCDMNSECHWVACLNDFADLQSKQEHTLNASLRYGVKLVEALQSDLWHDESKCSCESCSWIRSSQRLIEEFEQNLPPNPYRPAH